MCQKRRTAQSKYDKANEMRDSPTPAEEVVWSVLQQINQKFPEHFFQRQYVAYGYIIDFFCKSLKIGLEVDGSVHNENHISDRFRESNLKRRGITLFRVKNEDVFTDSAKVGNEICAIIQYYSGRPGTREIVERKIVK